MTLQRIAIGTVVGGIVFFFLGYLIFGILLADFFMSNAGSATGVMRDPISFGPLIVGQLAWGAALTLILGWSGASSVAQAAKTSWIIGLLFMIGMDFTMYGTSNINNMTATVVDATVASLLFAIAGAAIAAATGRKA